MAAPGDGRSGLGVPVTAVMSMSGRETSGLDDTVYRTPLVGLSLEADSYRRKVVRPARRLSSRPDVSLPTSTSRPSTAHRVRSGHHRRGHTRVTGVTAKASYRPADPKSDNVAIRDNAEVVVERLGIDDVVAGDLHYLDGTLISTSGTGRGSGRRAPRPQRRAHRLPPRAAETTTRSRAQPDGHVEVGESSVSFSACWPRVCQRRRRSA